MPTLWSAQRLKYAALIAVLALPPLYEFANACGQIHGRACGVLQLFALLFVIPPLIVSSSLAPSDAGDRTFSMAFVGVNFLIVGALAYFAIFFFAVLRRSSGKQ